MNRLGYALALLLGLTMLLLAGCGSGEVPPQDAQSSVAVPGTAVSQPPSSATPPSVTAALKSTSNSQYRKTTTGFTCSIKVTIWDRLPKTAQAPVAHPANKDATIDPTSDYDPKTDVVIPFELTLKNTTKGFDLQNPGIAYWIDAWTREESRSLAEPRVLELWGWYDNGWQKKGWSVGTNLKPTPDESGIWPAPTWSTSLAPGDSVSHYGYVVYRDHRTPAEPSGSAWVLDDLAIGVNYKGDDGDSNPMPYETRELSLTGELGQFQVVY